jgi:hypothetical protein
LNIINNQKILNLLNPSNNNNTNHKPTNSAMSYGKSNNSNNHHNSMNIPNTPKTARANPNSVSNLDKELTLPPIVESHILTKTPSSRSFKKSNSINRLDQEFASNDSGNNNNNANNNTTNHKTNNHWTLSSNASENDFDMMNGGNGEVVITTVEMVDNNSNYNTPLKKNNTSSTLNSYGKSSSIHSRLTATSHSSNKNNNPSTTINTHYPITVSNNSSALSKANSILKLNDNHRDNIQLSILASEANYLESLERLYTLNGDAEQAQQNFDKLEELKFKTNLISKDLNIFYGDNNLSNTQINPNSNLIVNSVINQTNTTNIMSKIENSKNNDKSLSFDFKNVTFNNNNNNNVNSNNNNSNENSSNSNNNNFLTSNNTTKNKSSSNTQTTVMPMTNRSNNLARESTHLANNSNNLSNNNKLNITRQNTIIGNSTSNNDLRKNANPNSQHQINKPIIKPRQQSQQQQQQPQKIDNTKRSNSFIRQNTFTNANSISENVLASNNRNNLKENNKTINESNKNKFALNSNRSNDALRPKTTNVSKNNYQTPKQNTILIENGTTENNDHEKDDYVVNEENENVTTKLILPQDQVDIINPDNNLSEYTISRILNWLKDIEKCSSMVKPPSQLTWTNRPEVRNNMQNAANDRKHSNEYCLSEFDSIDDQIIEYNRIVDKTFHIVHFDD